MTVCAQAFHSCCISVSAVIGIFALLKQLFLWFVINVWHIWLKQLLSRLETGALYCLPPTLWINLPEEPGRTNISLKNRIWRFFCILFQSLWLFCGWYFCFLLCFCLVFFIAFVQQNMAPQVIYFYVISHHCLSLHEAFPWCHHGESIQINLLCFSKMMTAFPMSTIVKMWPLQKQMNENRFVLRLFFLLQDSL